MLSRWKTLLSASNTEQGAHFDDFKNADYWNAHVAWFVNKNLTLVGAYVNAGDHKSSSKVGLGDGVVLQYPVCILKNRKDILL